MSRQIPTEYEDFPVREDIVFMGDRTRKDYKSTGELSGKIVDFGEVIERKADQLGARIEEAVKALETIAKRSSGSDINMALDTIAKVMGEISGRERIEWMMNYKDRNDRRGFFSFVYYLGTMLDRIQSLQVSGSAINNKRNIIGNYPRILSLLRITPMGPEPNQVNAMCKTQYDVGRTGAPQFDQCKTVYDMCRGKQDQFGVVDHKRDLLCTRYIKKQVFPKQAAYDPDVEQYFANYDYARDGPDYLKTLDLAQHRWDQEYNLDNGKLTQWDTSYKAPVQLYSQEIGDDGQFRMNKYSEDPINYADRKFATTAARQAGVNELVANRPTESRYFTESEAAFNKLGYQAGLRNEPLARMSTMGTDAYKRDLALSEQALAQRNASELTRGPYQRPAKPIGPRPMEVPIAPFQQVRLSAPSTRSSQWAAPVQPIAPTPFEQFQARRATPRARGGSRA